MSDILVMQGFVVLSLLICFITPVWGLYLWVRGFSERIKYAQKAREHQHQIMSNIYVYTRQVEESKKK